MGDPEQVPKRSQQLGFDELAEAPLEALGLASGASAALTQAVASGPSASWPTNGASAAPRRP